MPIKQHLSCSFFLLRLAFLSNELSPSQCSHTIIIVRLLMAQVHWVEELLSKDIWEKCSFNLYFSLANVDIGSSMINIMLFTLEDVVTEM